MQRLVGMLFSDASLAPTLEKITPQEWPGPDRCHPHRVAVEPDGHGHGYKAVRDAYGQLDRCFFHCYDDSLFWQALRLLRIGVDDEGVYRHEYVGGKAIPDSEVKRVARLVRDKR